MPLVPYSLAPNFTLLMSIIIETFITKVHASEVISFTWLIFDTEIPHCLGACLLHGLLIFKSLKLYLTNLSLKEAENIKISYCNLLSVIGHL